MKKLNSAKKQEDIFTMSDGGPQVCSCGHLTNRFVMVEIKNESTGKWEEATACNNCIANFLRSQLK